MLSIPPASFCPMTANVSQISMCTANGAWCITTSHRITTNSSRTRRGLRPESGKHTDLSVDREDCLLTWRRCHSYRYISEVSCVPPAKHPSGFVLLISPPPLTFHAQWPLWGTRVGHNASSRTLSITKALLSNSSVRPKLCKQLCITRDNECKSDLRGMARALCSGRYPTGREKQMKVW